MAREAASRMEGQRRLVSRTSKSVTFPLPFQSDGGISTTTYKYEPLLVRDSFIHRTFSIDVSFLTLLHYDNQPSYYFSSILILIVLSSEVILKWISEWIQFERISIDDLFIQKVRFYASLFYSIETYSWLSRRIGDGCSITEFVY